SRSLPRVADALLPALDAAGVPVVDAGAELPPAHDPVVAALLLLLHTALEGGRGTDTEATLRLLSGPIGTAHPVAMRRLRRGLRPSGIGEGVAREQGLHRMVDDEKERYDDRTAAVDAAPAPQAGAAHRAT